MSFSDHLPLALEHLAKNDRDLAKAIELYGPPPPRSRTASFTTLLNIILAQQISVAAAASIQKRLTAAMSGKTPQAFRALSSQQLRRIGFSRQKILYGRDLADAFLKGRLSLPKLRRMEDEMVIDHLIAIKGFGRWSAEMFLLFALERPDVMPAQDLALLIAAQRLKKLPDRPKPKELLAIAEQWRPWRSYAARLLWHYYHIAPI